MTVIDAHQHVWDPDRAVYEWLDSAMSPIDRAIGFDELRPSLVRAGVDATVLVESADNAEDTQLMLDTAAANPEVVGIVVFVPMDDPAALDSQLAALRRNELVVGVRNLIHIKDDPDWLLRPEVDESLGILERTGATFDFVGELPRHLELVPMLSERHPELRMVIDHLNKPPIGRDSRDPWWALIAAAAQNPNVYAKVSGLYSASGDSASWTVDGIRPYFDRAVEVFGPARLMYGGDWPISVLSGGYDRVWDGLNELFDTLDPAGRSRVLGGTAAEFYGIPADRLERLGTK